MLEREPSEEGSVNKLVKGITASTEQVSNESAPQPLLLLLAVFLCTSASSKRHPWLTGCHDPA